MLLRRQFGFLRFAMACVVCLCALCIALGCIWLCAGIRKAVFAAQAVWFACVFAGIRRAVFAAQAVWFCLCLRWHPRYAFVLHASPLCGAAPTFLCRRKEK
ncbi:hypothetical protein BZM27_50120 [Paraburkholderia steynii]|uniref:Uncharacterized protein n=1 Tax=Paraburkholderia steynii TaxID=1245441 RepID=A0A4R0X6Z7_9BURK|nr:hypothetical protein BZM27_50120 [Paraburkholderia steynii]